jgi:hypothetical protein
MCVYWTSRRNPHSAPHPAPHPHPETHPHPHPHPETHPHPHLTAGIGRLCVNGDGETENQDSSESHLSVSMWGSVEEIGKGADRDNPCGIVTLEP